MRTRFGNFFWDGSGSGRRALIGVSLLCLVLAAGCAERSDRVNVDALDGLIPVDETGPWTSRGPTQKEVILAKSDFSVDIVRFTDVRRPRSMEVDTPDQIISFYDPDVLMQGVSVQVPALLNKYLAYRPKKAKHYKVEMDLHKLRTTIKTGTFWSGSWGRYDVDMELRALARRPDSKAVWAKTYRIHLDQPRESLNGYAPSKERDRARMFDLTETVMRNAAEQIGWDIRQRDARTWDIEKEQQEKARIAAIAPVTQGLPPVVQAEVVSGAMPLPPLAPGQVEVEDGVVVDPSSTWPEWLKNTGIQAF